jgi:AP endonuclease-2
VSDEFSIRSCDSFGRLRRGIHVNRNRFFVIFNLYCPNETNETRLPYKLNFLTHLSSRISNLIAQGRNVIVLGDINVCHTPLDNGEGGIQRNAQEHYTHPARQWFDAWLADGKGGRGVMWDVTRRCWPDRKGMFTCGLPELGMGWSPLEADLELG